MPIEYLADHVRFHDRISAEEAEALLQWLQAHERATVQLGAATHMHTAVLQVLLAARCAIALLPEEPRLRAWLLSSMPWLVEAPQADVTSGV